GDAVPLQWPRPVAPFSPKHRWMRCGSIPIASVGAAEVAQFSVGQPLLLLMPPIDCDRHVEFLDRGAPRGAGPQRCAPTLQRLSLLPRHPMASKGFNRLDELRFGLFPLA